MTLESQSVFIVEDEALIAMELRERLTQLGYQVCGVAAHGERALEQIPGSGAEIVLMDIHLAGRLNGIEVAALLRKQTDAAVVFLTAYPDAELLRQAGTVEPFGYLVKPFQMRELHATIQMAVGKLRGERALRQANELLDQKVRERTEELAAANQALRDREAMLSGINANLVGTAVYRLVFDPNGKMSVTYVSPNAESLIGVSAAEFMTDADRFFQMVEPADLPRMYAAIADALRTKESLLIDARIRHAHGGIRWFQFRSRLIQVLPDGTQVRDGVATDITEQKQSEAALRQATQKYRNIFDNAVEGIYQSSVDGRPISVNRCARSHLRL